MAAKKIDRKLVSEEKKEPKNDEVNIDECKADQFITNHNIKNKRKS